LHPILLPVLARIKQEVIIRHNVPMRIFETGREHDRHDALIKKGKTKDIISRHLYNMENDPPLYATAVDYVHFEGKWSWNLRDSSISAWYALFGNLVLDICPELEWAGFNRKGVNFCHFQLKESVIVNSFDTIPSVIP